MSDRMFVTSYQPYEEGVRIKNALHRWRRKLLEAQSEGLSVVDVTYRSNIIPKKIYESVYQNLEEANTPEEIEAAFEDVIRHYLLGRIGLRPEDRDKPLPHLSVDVEITESDIDEALQHFEKWAEENAPDLVGFINAEVINNEEEENDKQ